MNFVKPLSFLSILLLGLTQSAHADSQFIFRHSPRLVNPPVSSSPEDTNGPGDVDEPGDTGGPGDIGGPESEIDITPDPFSFATSFDVDADELITSDDQRLTGFVEPILVSVGGGAESFRICGNTSLVSCDAGHFSPTLVPPGTYVRLVARSGWYEESVEATMTVGDTTETWNLVSRAYGQSPDPFSFPDKANIAPSSWFDSNYKKLTGLVNPMPISVSGPASARYCIARSTAGAPSNNANDPCWKSDRGTIQDGDLLWIGVNSSDQNAETVTVAVKVGDMTVNWNVTTRPLDTEPDNFTIQPPRNSPVEPGTWVTPNNSYIKLAGLKDPVPLVVSGPPSVRYCIGANTSKPTEGDPCWTSGPSTIKEGNFLWLSMNASDQYDTTETVVVQIGSSTFNWTVTTKPAP